MFAWSEKQTPKQGKYETDYINSMLLNVTMQCYKPTICLVFDAILHTPEDAHESNKLNQNPKTSWNNGKLNVFYRLNVT